MKFDIQATVKGMLAAAQGKITTDWPKVRDCVRRALEEESQFLGELAQARIDGEIDDDTLAQQLRDEERTFEDTLLPCAVMTKKMAQDAANAAIDAFNSALSAAISGATKVAMKKPNGSALKAPTKKGKLTVTDRRLNARPDTLDFRDLMYQPTLVEVGSELPLSEYKKAGVPILDQGREGACTGYGLATVVHYLLRSRDVVPDKDPVSPRMLYAMARRYDEWPGEAYEGSSCRGAMKAWHKHGVCSLSLWKHDPTKPDNALDSKRAADAQQRPLGAYLRVNHKDLVAMHAAITEVGALYVSSSVHEGWQDVKSDGVIQWDGSQSNIGGHAFALVAYDHEGFWLQNSWGTTWGKGGFARVSYSDWLAHGDDAWVARLGVPLSLSKIQAAGGATFSASGRTRAIAYEDVRPHVVSMSNDGQLKSTGPIGTTPALLAKLVHEDFAGASAKWAKRRLMVYAHGGLVGEDSAVQKVASYASTLVSAEVYPIAFIWHTDFWSVLRDVLGEALQRRKPEGVLDSAKDFMLDRADDLLEPLARTLGGKSEWDEMKENALLATRSQTGGARLLAKELQSLAKKSGPIEIHLVAHSAGSILLGPLAHYLATDCGLPIESCTLWAPACTVSLFEEYYAPLVQSGDLKRFAVFTLTDQVERDDDCQNIYNKSLLYLVSNAFEARARIPVFRPAGEPILGLRKFAEQSAKLAKLVKSGSAELVLAPNTFDTGDSRASRATSHTAFDDDIDFTLKATLARILGGPAGKSAKAVKGLTFRGARADLADRRSNLNIASSFRNGARP